MRRDHHSGKNFANALKDEGKRQLLAALAYEVLEPADGKITVQFTMNDSYIATIKNGPPLQATQGLKSVQSTLAQLVQDSADLTAKAMPVEGNQVRLLIDENQEREITASRVSEALDRQMRPQIDGAKTAQIVGDRSPL